MAARVTPAQVGDDSIERASYTATPSIGSADAMHSHHTIGVIYGRDLVESARAACAVLRLAPDHAAELLDTFGVAEVIRVWAWAEGIACPDSGPIPREALDLYAATDRRAPR